MRVSPLTVQTEDGVVLILCGVILKKRVGYLVLATCLALVPLAQILIA